MIRRSSSLIPAILAAIGLPLIRHSLRKQVDIVTPLDEHNRAHRAASASKNERETIAAAIAKRARKAAKKAAELNLQALRNAS